MLSFFTKAFLAILLLACRRTSATLLTTPEACFSTLKITWTSDLHVCPTDDLAYVGFTLQFDIVSCLGINIYAALGKSNDLQNPASYIGCGHIDGLSLTGDFPMLLPTLLRPTGVGLASLNLVCDIKQSALEVSTLFDCKREANLEESLIDPARPLQTHFTWIPTTS
ncbi:hypothetical protein NliqN6_5309 [Naganishia liquefaciens]|uniref:Uncharacterized protein n=1 Tax=Naganishia liquefaciens TaxID=104408 RepID=A0A8H3TXH9_9TREE|nr:hypothetical protein NliqN6_5309 [Naganishia liquefaciens]